MLKKTLTGCALAGVLTLSLAGPAMADIADSTLDTTLKVTPAKAGTAKSPKPLKLTLGIEGGTKSGTGMPSTTTRLKVQLPSGIVWNGKAWPKKQRCDVNRVNRERSLKSCPKGAIVGKGHVTALAGNGALVEEIDVTAVVTSAGNLGLYLDATVPVPIQTMIEGKVSKKGLIDVAIPANIQQPALGVRSSIKTLTFSLEGKTRVKGRSMGVVASTGCKKSWKMKVTNVMTDGSLTDIASASCRR